MYNKYWEGRGSPHASEEVSDPSSNHHHESTKPHKDLFSTTTESKKKVQGKRKKVSQ